MIEGSFFRLWELTCQYLHPDGSWLCDDDSGDGLSPLLTLVNPESGIYDIWVGSVLSPFGYTDGTLVISE